MSVDVSVDNDEWETGDAPNAPNDIDLKLPQWTSTHTANITEGPEWLGSLSRWDVFLLQYCFSWCNSKYQSNGREVKSIFLGFLNKASNLTDTEPEQFLGTVISYHFGFWILWLHTMVMLLNRCSIIKLHSKGGQNDLSLYSFLPRGELGVSICC